MKTYEIFTDNYSKIVVAVSAVNAWNTFRRNCSDNIIGIFEVYRLDLLNKIDATPKAVTDGEIKQAAPHKHKMLTKEQSSNRNGFINGAKWMREQQGEGAKEDYVMDLINFASA